MAKRIALAIIVLGGLAACEPGGILDTNTQLGAAQGTVGSRTETQLVKCAQPVGTAALIEEQDPTTGQSALQQSLGQVGLPNPTPLLRLMMSRSNCFQVVDRGVAGELMRQERELMSEGELAEGSSPLSGQMIAADYLITPHVVFQDQNAGGANLGAAIGALGSSLIPGLGILAGNIKTTNLEAQVALYLTDVRTGLQVSVAEGTARKRDIGFGLGGLGAGGATALGAAGGAYASTDVGKIVSAAFLDAYNNLVRSVQ